MSGLDVLGCVVLVLLGAAFLLVGAVLIGQAIAGGRTCPACGRAKAGEYGHRPKCWHADCPRYGS